MPENEPRVVGQSQSGSLTEPNPPSAPHLPPASRASAANPAARLASGLVLAGLAAQAAPLAEPVAETEPPPGTAPHSSSASITAAPEPLRSQPAPRILTPPAPATQQFFCNPIAPGADPGVVRHAGRYYFCEPVTDNSIAIWTSERLTARGQRRIIWRAPRRAWNSRLIWAPELHRLDGRWYIYYSAAAGAKDNASHRVGVLQSHSDDPLGPYTDRGQIYTGDDPAACSGDTTPCGADSGRRASNRWAIDATVLELRGRRYLLWSGWPGRRDVQYLYIAPLANPSTTAGPRVRICDNATYAWERVDEDPRERGLHEAPQVLQRDGRVFLVYSCSGSWQPTYKLGLLELGGDGDPLKPANWTKHPEPVFQSTPEVRGVGHASFIQSPDGREDWLIYHAKISAAPGWKRVVCVQRFGWHADGRPDFGRPAPWHVPLAAPSGDPAAALKREALRNAVHHPRRRRMRLPWR